MMEILATPLVSLFPPLFAQKEKAAEKEEQKKLWPSSLNPCPLDGRHGKGASALFDVGGRVTKLCCACLWEREARMDGDRRKALATFTSDPKGNLCKYYDGDE